MLVRIKKINTSREQPYINYLAMCISGYLARTCAKKNLLKFWADFMKIQITFYFTNAPLLGSNFNPNFSIADIPNNKGAESDETIEPLTFVRI